jgi:hypothetical protein
MSDKPSDSSNKTLGQAIDEIIRALQPLDQGARITAVKASCEHLNITMLPSQKEKAKPESMSVSAEPTSEVSMSGVRDIRALKEQKRPSSAIEMAAMVAYYLSELVPEQERQKTVSLEDVKKYFKQALFPLPGKPQFLLTNAKNAGYFDSVGGGKFQLNPVGYNLVVHNLPREGSGATTKTMKPKRRSNKPKSTKKKK